MKILITGATGLVGKAVSKELLKDGHTIRGISRNIKRAKEEVHLPIEWIEWNSDVDDFPLNALKDISTVIHLMGENISNSRWNEEQKEKILKSRMVPTQKIVSAILKANKENGNPITFIQASAVGIYPEQAIGDKTPITETSTLGTTFLSSVCQNWEKASEVLLTEKTEKPFDSEYKNLDNPIDRTIRRIVLRFGVILSREGGAFEKLRLPLSKFGLASNLGNGRSIMSWIHIDDVTAFIKSCITDTKKEGIYNLTAPEPISNAEMTQEMKLRMNAVSFLPVPTFAMHFILGEMASIILSPQKVIPSRAIAERFNFSYPNFKAALSDLRPESEFYSQVQTVSGQLSEVFQYFSDASNLKDLTPKWIQLEFIDQVTKIKSAGTNISYKMKIHGVPMTWKTLIQTWNPPSEFVDIQEKGPYTKWEHHHLFFSYHSKANDPESTDRSDGHENADQTIIEDRVYYQLPLGPFGNLLGSPIIEHDIKQIFEYRFQSISKKFN